MLQRWSETKITLCNFGVHFDEVTRNEMGILDVMMIIMYHVSLWVLGEVVVNGEEVINKRNYFSTMILRSLVCGIEWNGVNFLRMVEKFSRTECWDLSFF